MLLHRQLSTRLFFLLLVILIGVFSLYTYLNIKVQTAHLMKNVIDSADHASDLIRRSTRYSMLLNRKEDVYHIIRTLGETEGFDGIRIYNKNGEIIFSTNREEINQTVDTKAEACTICHSEGTPKQTIASSLATRIFQSSDGHRVLGLINAIRNEPDCSTAPCHAHPSSQTVLGVLDVKMSLTQVDEAITDSRKKTIIFFILTVLIVTVFSGVFIRYMVHIPVKKLIKGTRALSKGNLDYHINIERYDEIGELAKSFNTMTENLKTAHNEITTWSKTLEQKVEEKTLELQKAQNQIIQVEKMVSLGKLSASVAHEINNPLAGILTYTKLILKKLNGTALSEEEQNAIKKFLSLIYSETARCGNIVKNLLLFARKGDAEFSQEDILAIIDKSLQLIDHHLEMQKIKLEKRCPDGSLEIYCDGNQLQQAFIALLINAIESMESGGILTVEVARTKDEKEIEIKLSDTGHGIHEDVLPHIFEPFFTTKREGKGVGLGLSVVYGIIRRHNGEIKVTSKLQEGTIFTLILPVKSVPSLVKESFF